MREKALADRDRAKALADEKLAPSSYYEGFETALAAAEADLATAAGSVQAAAAAIEGAAADHAAARSRVESAAAALEEARLWLRRSEILSPIDGALSAAFHEQGEIVEANKPLFMLVATARVKAVFALPERDIALFAKGAAAEVTVASLAPQPLRGTVTLLGVAANAATSTYRLEVELPNADGRLKAGMLARLRILRRSVDGARHRAAVRADARQRRAARLRLRERRRPPARGVGGDRRRRAPAGPGGARAGGPAHRQGPARPRGRAEGLAPVIVTDAAVRHRTTVFVMMAIVVLAGVFAFTALPRESAPDIKIPYMNVITIYPGVAPGDVETLLTIPIENELKNLRDVEHVTSVSAEGASVITIQFKPDVDLDLALQRVKEKVDTAQQELPEEAEDPLVEEISTSDFPIMQVNVTGDVGLVRLKQIAEDLQERIEGVRGVLRAQLIGGREREIHVEFDPERLAAYRLSAQEVAQAVKGANVNIPGGSLELGEANYLVRVPGEFADPAEIGSLVVARREGRAVYVRDLARVVDGFKEDETVSRHNGVPSVSLSIQKRAGENIIRICDEVRAILAEERGRAPAGVAVDVSFDESRVIARMLTDLNNNMINGLVLVIVVLFFTMGLLSSIFVALAIPFSMLITLAVLHALGYTLNIIVLFSLVLVLGMLVDNAIVIVENIYRHQEEGEEPIAAALNGTREVAWPVVASSATNIAPFVPMIFWPGIMGEFMAYLPKTVIIGLLASLFVALIVNPTLCAAFMRVRPERRLAAGGGVHRASCGPTSGCWPSRSTITGPRSRGSSRRSPCSSPSTRSSARD